MISKRIKWNIFLLDAIKYKNHDISWSKVDRSFYVMLTWIWILAVYFLTKQSYESFTLVIEIKVAQIN